jgi:hypothetical protein
MSELTRKKAEIFVQEKTTLVESLEKNWNMVPDDVKPVMEKELKTIKGAIEAIRNALFVPPTRGATKKYTKLMETQRSNMLIDEYENGKKVVYDAWERAKKLNY